MNITYGTHEFDTTKLPEQTIAGMLKRGVTHFLGNEQAAKVTNWSKKVLKDTGALPSDDELAAKKAEFVAAGIAAMLAGEVGQGSRGPATDPLELEMERVAKAEITEIVKKNGGKWSGKGEERGVTFKDGSRLTMDEMVERRLSNPDHGPRIQKEADKAIKAKAKEAEKAKTAGGLSDASAIG